MLCSYSEVKIRNSGGYSLQMNSSGVHYKAAAVQYTSITIICGEIVLKILAWLFAIKAANNYAENFTSLN